MAMAMVMAALAPTGNTTLSVHLEASDFNTLCRVSPVSPVSLLHRRRRLNLNFTTTGSINASMPRKRALDELWKQIRGL